MADPDRNGSVDVQELTDLLYDVQVELAAAAEADAEGGEGSGETTLSAICAGPGGANAGSAHLRVERLLSKRASQKWS